MANQYPSGKPNPHQKNSKFAKNYGPRRNERIRVPRVRVIGPDGTQVGVMPTAEALALARKYKLDLIEVSPNAEPPVCRILDYGKYLYEEAKKQKSNKTSTAKVKEVKLRPHIDRHDYETKMRNAERFLFSGNKLKITMMLRGREMEFKNIAFDIVKRAIADLNHMGHADSEPKLMGKNIGVTISPVAQNQRKLKYSGEDEDIPEEDDSASDSE
ncbi:translation initiation factor IF-3 [Intestinicryptomonas porci]|uniref:Translation initiation factor IF-3 n=1 Tax=Intestinicryptomonas porci TaxID=2926320 RepID=A0ABU4WJZ4_9BACT|nr:translation initiation factor IF-3 [Opitutales bacterium CLA-KB-P66]